MRTVSILAILIVMFAVICDVGLAEKVVSYNRTVERGGLRYEVNSEEPFTGKLVAYYPTERSR